jgi:hypothetical protein
MRVRFCVVLLLTLMAVATFPYEATARKASGHPAVIPANAQFRGLSYGEWGAKWWQAAFAIPVIANDHPLFSGGVFGGDKGVVFLSGVFGPPAVTIDVTVRPGTALFFPIVNTECSVLEGPPFHGDNEQELRDCANGLVDQTFGLFGEIDGVKVTNLDSFRVESPLFEFGPLPTDNIFGAPPGTTSLSVDAGVYLMVHPLSAGRHVIHFGAASGPIDTTYIIHVSQH